MTKAERARELFLEGCNCAQAVFLAFAEEKMDRDTALKIASGFGGGMASKLREKSVNGNTVTFTVDYYAYDDVDLTTSLHAKTYTITFYHGGYFYDSAVEAAV